jgi:hypothetical protein
MGSMRLEAVENTHYVSAFVFKLGASVTRLNKSRHTILLGTYGVG